MVMPGPQEALTFLANNPNQPVQFPGIKPVILGDRNVRFEPDLCFVPAAADMNMRRPARAAFVRQEGEAEALASEDSRQDGFSTAKVQLHPIVAAQMSHFKHVPLRAMVKSLHSGQLSPHSPS
jgi:hypothetical protein